MTRSRLTRFITGWISVLNEWFNDSLKIDSIRYWMNQCFWMNLLNEWFNDSLKIDSFLYWMNQCSWMNDSMTRSRLTRFITGWIRVLNESLEWMIQWLTQDWLDSLLDESLFLNESLEWMIQWLTPDWLVSLLDESVFLNESLEWMIQWLAQDWLVSLLDESVFLNESLEWMIQWLTPDWLVSLLDESVFLNESLEWMIQWLAQDWLVSLLNESVFLNESLEWMIQWLAQDWLVSLLDESVFFEWISWMNDSVTHSRLTRFITGRISVLNEWLTQDWLVSFLDESVFLNDSKTNTYLTAHFLHLKIKDAHTGIDEWNLNVILQQVSDSGIDLWSPTLHITHSQRRRGGTDGSFSLWLSLSYLTGASHTSAVITDPRRLRRPDASLSVLCNYPNRVSAALTKVKKTLGTNRTGHNTSMLPECKSKRSPLLFIHYAKQKHNICAQKH